MVCIVALAYVLALHRHETLQLRVWFHQAEVLDQDDAPELFTHLGLLAERVGGVPPDKVIVGLAAGLYLVEVVAGCVGDPVRAPGRASGARPQPLLSPRTAEAPRSRRVRCPDAP